MSMINSFNSKLMADELPKNVKTIRAESDDKNALAVSIICGDYRECITVTIDGKYISQSYTEDQNVLKNRANIATSGNVDLQPLDILVGSIVIRRYPDELKEFLIILRDLEKL